MPGHPSFGNTTLAASEIFNSEAAKVVFHERTFLRIDETDSASCYLCQTPRRDS